MSPNRQRGCGYLSPARVPAGAGSASRPGCTCDWSLASDAVHMGGRPGAPRLRAAVDRLSRSWEVYWSLLACGRPLALGICWFLSCCEAAAPQHGSVPRPCRAQPAPCTKMAIPCPPVAARLDPTRERPTRRRQRPCGPRARCPEAFGRGGGGLWARDRDSVHRRRQRGRILRIPCGTGRAGGPFPCLMPAACPS